MNNTQIQLKEITALLTDNLLAGLSKDQHDYRPDPREGDFRASQMPYCSRKLVFTNLLDWKTPAALEAKGLGGSIVHFLIQILLSQSDLQIINESEIFLPIGEKLSIFGHADILILDYQEYLICFDIKTTDSFSYLDYSGKANSHNIKQLTIYLSYLKRKYKHKKIIGILWYILRTLNNQQILYLLNPKNWRLFLIQYDEQTFSDLIIKINNIYSLLQKEILPAIDAENWECQNKTATCPYYSLCYKNYINNFDELFTELFEIRKLKRSDTRLDSSRQAEADFLQANDEREVCGNP